MKIKFNILFIVLSTLLIFSNAFVNQINRDSNFWLYTKYNNENFGQSNLNLCFSGIGRFTRYLMVEDPSINISSVLSDSFSISEGVHSAGKKTNIESVVFNSALNRFELESKFFKSFNEQKTYCLHLISKNVKDLNSVTTLQLKGAASDDINGMIYNSINYFTKLNTYNIDAAALSATMPTKSISTTPIFDTTEFDCTLNFEVNLAEGRLIPTEGDQAVVMIQ